MCFSCTSKVSEWHMVHGEVFVLNTDKHKAKNEPLREKAMLKWGGEKKDQNEKCDAWSE